MVVLGKFLWKLQGWGNCCRLRKVSKIAAVSTSSGMLSVVGLDLGAPHPRPSTR